MKESELYSHKVNIKKKAGSHEWVAFPSCFLDWDFSFSFFFFNFISLKQESIIE